MLPCRELDAIVFFRPVVCLVYISNLSRDLVPGIYLSHYRAATDILRRIVEFCFGKCCFIFYIFFCASPACHCMKMEVHRSFLEYHNARSLGSLGKLQSKVAQRFFFCQTKYVGSKIGSEVYQRRLTPDLLNQERTRTRSATTMLINKIAAMGHTTPVSELETKLDLLTLKKTS